MKQAQHTPLPWSKSECGPLRPNEWLLESMLGKDTDGVMHVRTIGLVFDYGGKEEAEANAAYIVQACNAYPQLIEALTRLARISELINSVQHAHNPLNPSLWSELYMATQEARAALANTQEVAS